MKWTCSLCGAINPFLSFKCHNCPNTSGDELMNKYQATIHTLEKIGSGSECSACSCNCHELARETIIKSGYPPVGEKK